MVWLRLIDCPGTEPVTVVPVKVHIMLCVSQLLMVVKQAGRYTSRKDILQTTTPEKTA